MKKGSENINIKLIYALLIAQLISLYVIKYVNQNLSLSEFSILNIGNLFNLILHFGLIIGIFISTRKQSLSLSQKGLILYLVILWSLLITAFISTKVKFISSSIYFLNLPGDKILTGILFISYLFFFFYLLLTLWIGIIFKRNTSLIKNIINTILSFIIFLVIILIYEDNAGYSSGRWSLIKNKNNIAVVLGAAVWSENLPSPTLSSRVDKAIELIKEGFAGKIILTGGNAPGEMSESEVALEYAKTKWVDTKKILTESSTGSTAEQIEWIKRNLSQNEKDNHDIILISDSYHLPRVIEISKFFNLDIKVAESSHKLNFKDKLINKLRECVALFNFWCFAL
jgi:vancomycin permeability regulator SanA